MSVTTAMQGLTAAHHETQRDSSKKAREPGYAQATGRFRRWWQVLDSNQRRLSRRFHRPPALIRQYGSRTANMWPTVVFETGPVRYMSVRAGGQTAASTDGHGQRPCKPVDPGNEGSVYENSLLGSAGVIAGLGLVIRPPLRGWAASFRGLPPEAGAALR